MAIKTHWIRSKGQLVKWKDVGSGPNQHWVANIFNREGYSATVQSSDESTWEIVGVRHVDPTDESTDLEFKTLRTITQIGVIKALRMACEMFQARK